MVPFVALPGPHVSGEVPALGSVLEAEVEESLKVGSGDLSGQAEAVSFDTSVADPAVIVDDG